MKKINLLLLFFIVTVSMFADGLRGRAVDAKTNEPLPEAEVHVELAEAKNRSNFYQYMDIKTDSLGFFTISAERINNMIRGMHETSAASVKVTIDYFGYNQGYKSTMVFAGNDTVSMGNVKLKPGKALLKEVTVNGRIPRFTMVNDTVIFHPDAFHMDNTDRLGELVAKLPGISINGDQIYWNNRPLTIMMDGREVFGNGNMLMELPVEAVKNIKTYEKKSELAERTGKNDNNGKQVLDINIKPGFLDKIYGRIGVGGNTDKTYDGQLSLNKLSKDDPLIFLGRIGRGGRTMDGVSFGSRWSVSAGRNSKDYTQQIASLGYQHAWDSKFKKSKWRNSYDITTSVDHIDLANVSWEKEETYLDNGRSTFNFTNTNNNKHAFSIPVNFSFKKNISEETTNELKIVLSLIKTLDTQVSEAVQYDTLPSIDDALVYSSVSNRVTDSKKFSVSIYDKYTHYIKDGSLCEEMEIKFSNDEGTGDFQTDYTYRDKSISTKKDVQLRDNNSHNINAFLKTAFSKWIAKPIKLDLRYELSYNNEFLKNSIMRGDGNTMAQDLTNSLRQRNEVLNNRLGISLSQEIGKVYLSENFDATNCNQKLDYHRGTILNTLARRSTFDPSARAGMTWSISKRSRLSVNGDWSQNSPKLIKTLEYVDDSDPLFISKGNPNLSKSSNVGASLSYSITLPKGQQNMSFSTYYDKSYNPIMSLRTYDSGVYTITDINGRGGHEETVRMSYSRSLGKGFRTGIDISFKNSINYSYSMRKELGDTEFILRQQQNNWQIKPKISYDSNKWNIKLWGDVKKNDIANNDIDYINLHQWKYESGIDIRFRTGNWDFNLNPYMEGGSGYMSDMLNKTKLIFDGRINFKFLNKKATISFVANDIFNKFESTYLQVNADSRTEYGSNRLHHFVGLNFEYRFDAKEKKIKKSSQNGITIK